MIGYPTTYWYFLLAARHLLGDYEGELADVQRMRRTLGESSMASENELVALAALGRVNQVTSMVEAILAAGPPTGSFGGGGTLGLNVALELRAHGHADAAERLIERILRWYETATPGVRDSSGFRMRLAVTLFAAGRFADARPLFESVNAEDTTRWTARGFLGQVAARLGDRATAERELQWQLNRAGVYGAGEATVHAAAIAAELGDAERAVNLLRLAISQGFYYTNRGIHRQPQLEVLLTIPAAREVIRPKG